MITDQVGLSKNATYEYIHFPSVNRYAIKRTGDTGASNYNVKVVNSKYSCDCAYSLVNLLPCRHLLFLFREFNLSIITLTLTLTHNFNYLPRWLNILKQTVSSTNENLDQTTQITSTQYCTTSVQMLKSKMTSNDRYYAVKPYLDMHMSYRVFFSFCTF